MFNLVDPQTQQPFPQPLPRSSFPAHHDYKLAPGYQQFMTKLAMNMRTNAFRGGNGGMTGMGRGMGRGGMSEEHRQQMQERRRNAKLVGGAVKVAGHMMRGGRGGGFGGNGGFGGGGFAGGLF
jgi:hypothetical protein